MNFHIVKNLSKIARRCVKRRLESNETRRGDLLDRLIDDMRTKQGLGQTPFETSELSKSDMAQYEADVVTDAMLLLYVLSTDFIICQYWALNDVYSLLQFNLGPLVQTPPRIARLLSSSGFTPPLACCANYERS